MPTLVVDNFGGRLTRYDNGTLNSGLAKYATTFGMDPFSAPGKLTWMENAIQIDTAGAVVTDLIMAGKERVESGISYVYAIGHTGRLYKIQVNDPTTFNPNYDNPVLLATLTTGSPTFTRGGFIDFFGSTERIYIGHDKGLTRIDFNGANETVVGVLGSWVQSVPRPLKQFVGKLYIGNGANIAEVDSTGTVTTYTKLAPGFPDNTQVRDLDVSIDGNYIFAVVSRLALPDITLTTQDTTFLTNSESYIFKWNGTDIGYTSFDSFPSFSLNANQVFGAYQYTFGYDIAGGAIYNPTQKTLSAVLSQAPLPNAIGSNGNQLGWTTVEYYGGISRAAVFIYGPVDEETPSGWWRQVGQLAQGTETDVIRVPFGLLVSNALLGSSTNGYFAGIAGVSKGYFSTLEVSSSPTTKYKLYKWFPFALGLGTAVRGVYETQTELFSKKVNISEIRIYAKPWVAGNSFKLELIGSGGTPIANASKTFTAGATIGDGIIVIGADYGWYSPGNAPTYAIGLRITNLGVTNHTIQKIELEYEPAGK